MRNKYAPFTNSWHQTFSLFYHFLCTDANNSASLTSQFWLDFLSCCSHLKGIYACSPIWELIVCVISAPYECRKITAWQQFSAESYKDFGAPKTRGYELTINFYLLPQLKQSLRVKQKARDEKSDIKMKAKVKPIKVKMSQPLSQR